MARSRIEIAGEALEHQSDAALANKAAAGDREAFEELYRRHSRTAMRVAYRVTGNIHDAGDAVSDAFARVMQALPKGSLSDATRFRSYLLTSTRHAAVDVLRRSGKNVPVEDDPEPAQTHPTPPEVVIDLADSALVAAAFRGLPERWRSVLWLTEVEQIPPREAAGMLGVSANGVAQLAVRARNGLRDRYLQAHLRAVTGECRPAVERLGAYVGGGLAARDLALVDQHLADCEACRDRKDDLAEIGTTLRRGLAPAGAGGLGRWLWRAVEKAHRLAADWATPAAGAGAAKALPVGVAAAGVFVASLAGAGVVRSRAVEPAAPNAVVAQAPAALTTPALTAAADAAGTTAAAATRSGSSAARPVHARTAKAQTSAGAPARARTITANTAGETAAPAPTPTTTTTTTAPPPASHTEESTPLDEVLATLPTLPVEVPATLPLDPTTPTTVLGEALTDALADTLAELPLEVAGLLGESITSADQLLPAPEAPGLPV